MQARCRTSPSTAKTPRRPLVWLLEYDFCPWANRWLYWMKRPIASLALAGLAALACAIFVKPLALVACGATLVVVLLGYVWPSVAVRGLDCSIRFTQTRVSENEPATARVRIVNRWPWPVWGMSLEGGFDGGNEGGNPRAASVALARVAGWATTEFEWSFIPRCRGEYPSQPPRLVTGFPFGLRHASRPVTVEQPLLVWPQIVPLETLLDAAETRPSDDSYSDHRVGDSGDMTGTRPFRDGDSLRRVHWAQTARHGRMIVCERQAPAQSAIRVVFDSAQHLHRGSGGNSTLEWSIRLASTWITAFSRFPRPLATDCLRARPATLPPHSSEQLRSVSADDYDRHRPPTPNRTPTRAWRSATGRVEHGGLRRAAPGVRPDTRAAQSSRHRTRPTRWPGCRVPPQMEAHLPCRVMFS